ncbi:MAG: histidine phosphatase family protein [Bacteroidales bacterium]|nr:histidine phosphatase family protein [Bacteroidales bacterium]
MEKIWYLILAVLMPGISAAQTWQQLGSSYCAYENRAGENGILPDYRSLGLTPFYISHYGRHGSRWLTEDARYLSLLTPMDTIELTQRGKEIRGKLRLLTNDGIGRAGQLTPLGERQHHDIAQRMIGRFPEVFADSAFIRAKSSTAMRCAMSMAAFCEGLKEVNPSLKISRLPYPKLMQQMAYESAEAKAFKDSLESSRGYMEFVAATVDPSRIIGSLFANPDKMTQEQQIKWILELYWAVQSMQNVGLEDLDLYSIFTYEGMKALWKCVNARMYMCNSDTPIAAGRTIHCADSLLMGIIEDADAAIEAVGHGPHCSQIGEPRGCAADLRFGHDTHLLRLMSLMQIVPTPEIERYEDVAAQWHDYEFVPMAANLQLIFYHDSEGEVYVQALLNEKEILTPTPWQQLKNKWLQTLEEGLQP